MHDMTTFKPVARGEVEQTLFGSLDFLAHTLKSDLVSLNEAQMRIALLSRRVSTVTKRLR